MVLPFILYGSCSLQKYLWQHKPVDTVLIEIKGKPNLIFKVFYNYLECLIPDSLSMGATCIVKFQQAGRYISHDCIITCVQMMV